MKSIFQSTLLWMSFLLLTSLSMASCSNDDKENILPSKVEFTDFTVEQTGGTITLDFVAGSNWTASLSATSWIQLDATTRSGGAGTGKLKLEWSENTGVTERKSTLLLQIGNEPTYRVEVMQYPDQPVIVVSKSLLNLVVSPMAGGGRGLFTDTVTVNSNVRWSVEGLPNWLSVDADGEPAEGRQTSVKLVLTADQTKFNNAEMVASFKLVRVTNSSLESVLEAKAISLIEAFSTSNTAQEIATVVMAPSEASQGRYTADFMVKSNSEWVLSNLPSWAASNVLDNKEEYAATLLTEKTVRLFMQEGSLDTDRLSQKLTLTNSTTGATKEVELVFPGTGNDYFEVALFFRPDFEFSASRYDGNWMPLPGATLEHPFSITTAPYTNPNDAPYAVYFVKMENGWTFAEEATWLGYEPFVGRSARSPLATKEYDLYVNDRRMGFDADPSKNREALMVVVPSSVKFEDLFQAGTEDLKPEIEEKAYRIIQSALGAAKPDFFANFGDEDTVLAAGETKLYEFETNAENLNILSDADWVTPGNFVIDQFSGAPIGVEISYAANATGVTRSTMVRFVMFDMQTDEEIVLFELFVEQPSN